MYQYNKIFFVNVWFLCFVLSLPCKSLWRVCEMTKCKSMTLNMFTFLCFHCPRRAVVQVTCGTVRTWLPATPRAPPGSISLTTSARSRSAPWIRYQPPRPHPHHRRSPLRPPCPFIGSYMFSQIESVLVLIVYNRPFSKRCASVLRGVLCLRCGCVYDCVLWLNMLWLSSAVVWVLLPRCGS